jgi:hypothetical protein
MRRALLGAVLVTGTVLAAEPELPQHLEVTPGESVSIELTLETAWTSKDHKLRFMTDEAHLDAKLTLEPKDTVVEAKAHTLTVTRRKRAKIAGFFSDDDRDARGNARWSEGEKEPPPVWQLAPVNSQSPVWHLEAWLTNFDRGNDEEARLRRLVHYTDLGFLGTPQLPLKDHFAQAVTLELGEAGLTNKLVLVEAVYDLTVTRDEGTLLVKGPLAGLKLVHGEGPSQSVDQWLDVAFARGGPKAEGELSATYSLAKKRWSEARSTLSLEYQGDFEGGSGKATLKRTLRAAWE